MANTNRALAEFVTRGNEYYILNGAPTTTTVDAAGIRITFPASDEVVKPLQELLDRDPNYKPFLSLKDQDGNPIPGTLVLFDIFDLNNQLQWDATEAVKRVLGITASGQAESIWSKRGLKLIPKDFTPADIENLRAEARKAWEEYAIKRARRLKQEFQKEVAEAQAAGLTPPIPSAEIMRADRLLAQVQGQKPQTAVDQVYAGKKLEEIEATVRNKLLSDREFRLQLIADINAGLEEPAPSGRKKA